MITITKKKSPLLYNNLYMYISVFLYSFFGILFSIFKNDYFRLPQLVAFVIFFMIAYRLVNYYILFKRYAILFSFFFLWQLFVVLRMQFYNVNELRLILFDPLHFLSYLLPFAIIIPIRINKMITIFYSFLIFSASFLLLNIFLIIMFPINNFTDQIAISSLPPAGILLLLSKYSKKTITISAIVIVFSILFIGLMYGRRSVILSAALFIFLGYFVNILLNNKLRFSFKLVAFLLFFFISIYSITKFINSGDNNQFAIFDRADTDSRSDVITAFAKDFKFNDYIIGRGIDGAYYNPMKYWSFDNEESRDVTFRTNIENGFLYLVMKGGVIWLFLFLTILFRAIYLGFFKSKNLFSKALACYLFIYFIDMFVFGQPTFSIKYLLVWVCIVICTSIRFRSINENQLMRLINSKPLKKRITRELKG